MSNKTFGLCEIYCMRYWTSIDLQVNDIPEAHGGTRGYQHNSNDWTLSFQALDDARVLDIFTKSRSNFNRLSPALRTSSIFHEISEPPSIAGDLFYRTVRIKLETLSDWNFLVEKLRNVISNLDEVYGDSSYVTFGLSDAYANEERTVSVTHERDLY
jgi:hypothetical protein